MKKSIKNNIEINSNSILIGYGTFIYRIEENDNKFKILGVCLVPNYVRIFHKKLGFWYPFILPKKGHTFKAILYQISSNNVLKELDKYEGVPKLYNRIQIQANFNESMIESWIYIPTDETTDIIKEKIGKLDEKDQKLIYHEDLWLEYIKENYPNIKIKYPKLFTSIE